MPASSAPEKDEYDKNVWIACSFPRDILFTVIALWMWVYLIVQYHCLTEDTIVISIPRQFMLGVVLMYVVSTVELGMLCTFGNQNVLSLQDECTLFKTGWGGKQEEGGKMPSLGNIEAKLNELVKMHADKAEAAKPKEPTQEEKDEERLRELEAKIADLVELIHTGTTRDSADVEVDDHRDRVKSGKGEPRPLLRVFHDHGGKRIATTRRTQVYKSIFAILCKRMESTEEELGRLLVEQRKIFSSMQDCGICDRVHTHPLALVECLVKCDANQTRLRSIKPQIDKLIKKLMS